MNHQDASSRRVNQQTQKKRVFVQIETNQNIRHRVKYLHCAA